MPQSDTPMNAGPGQTEQSGQIGQPSQTGQTVQTGQTGQSGQADQTGLGGQTVHSGVPGSPGQPVQLGLPSQAGPEAAAANKAAYGADLPAASGARSTQPQLMAQIPPRNELTLRSAEFRKGREHNWRQLDDMVQRVEKRGIGALSADEVQLLPLLYRAVMSSLSVARNIVLDRNLLQYLENLSLRAYLVVYGPRSGALQNLRGFFAAGFPRSVRAISRHLLVATLAMLAGGVAGFVLVLSDMSYYSMLMPDSLAGGRGPDSTTAELRDTLFSPWPGFVETFIVFANYLFRHNSIVGIMSFGLGFALGIPTLLLMIYNGLVLGAFLALFYSHGLLAESIGWLSIHGVTELLAILLCGAGGLVLAEKIIFPGPLPRLESLANYGRIAAGVAAGAVAMLFIAGIIEGGFRQLVNNTPGRYAFALVTLALWFVYFAYCGKGGRHGQS